MPITANLLGTYSQLTNFLARVRRLVGVRDGKIVAHGRLFGVDWIQFVPNETDSQVLKATVKFQTYVYSTACGRGRYAHHDHAGTDRRPLSSRSERLMARKAPDPKAKSKKQKIILAVGGVILLGLLAFQLPKLMKGSPPPPDGRRDDHDRRRRRRSPATGAAGAPSSTPASAELTFSSSVREGCVAQHLPRQGPLQAAHLSSTASESAASAPAAPPPAAAAPTAPAVAAPAKGPLFGTVEAGTATPSSSVPNVAKARAFRPPRSC